MLDHKHFLKFLKKKAAIRRPLKNSMNCA